MFANLSDYYSPKLHTSKTALVKVKGKCMIITVQNYIPLKPVILHCIIIILVLHTNVLYHKFDKIVSTLVK